MSQEFIEALAEALRDEWVNIKRKELVQGKNIPPDHLTMWDKLDDRNKEIDRRLAVAVVKKYVEVLIPAFQQMIPE